MFRAVLKAVPRITARCTRQCSCWCPEEPLDPFTRATYLPNGVRVVTEETSSPLACISLFVTAGSRYETANCNGLTHFIEHLAYKGFKSMGRLQFEEYVLVMGAKMTAKTLREMQIFSVTLPAPLAAQAVTTLSKILTELEISESELEQEKANICLEMLDSDNDPRATVFEYLHATAFQGTPLGQPVIGPSRNISRFDKCTTAAFMCEHYTTCRLLLASCGGVTHNNIVETAANSFGYITPLGSAEPDPGPKRFTGSEVVYRDDSMPFAHVAIAVEAPGYNSPDYMPMLVMSELIGSWDKSQGRPNNQAHYTAQGAGLLDLCESYESFYTVYKDIGLWGVYFVAQKHLLDEMVFMVQHAWMQMTVMCHSRDVERAKNLTKVNVAKRYNGVVNSCRDIGTQMLYSTTRKPLYMLWNQIDVVQAFSVRAMGEKYIYGRSPVVVATGPTETLPEYNRIASSMYWLRW